MVDPGTKKILNRMTPFELALERSEKLADLVYSEYDNLNLRKRHASSFLLEYLTAGLVTIPALDKLIKLGENINYESNGENCFMKLLKEYSASNLISIITYMLKYVDLREEETKFRERNFSLGLRCFPSLFHNRRNSCHSLQQRANSNSRKGYNALGVVLKYCSRKRDRMALVRILMKEGSQVDHVTRKGRSLLHLTIKSNYSSLNEINFLVKSGIPIQWTDIKQAIKCSKIQFLHYLLLNSDPKTLNLKENLPDAMSMLVLKSKPADFRSADYGSADYRSADFRSADFRSVTCPSLCWFLQTFMTKHDLDPSCGRYSFYPLPLLFLLIFKNKLYSCVKDANGGSFYEDAIKLIASDERVDLEYRSNAHGTALIYAAKLDQPPSVINLLLPGSNGFKRPIDGTRVDGRQCYPIPVLRGQASRMERSDVFVVSVGDGYPVPLHFNTGYLPMEVGEPADDYQHYVPMEIPLQDVPRLHIDDGTD